MKTRILYPQLLLAAFCMLPWSWLHAQVDLIQNGDFSTGSFWTSDGDFRFNSNFQNCHSCPGYAWFALANGNGGDDIYGSIRGNLNMPSGVQGGTLSFYYSISTEEVNQVAYDYMWVKLFDGNGTAVWSRSFSNTNHTNGYSLFQSNLTPDKLQDVEMIEFSAENDGAKPTKFRVDEVRLEVQVGSGQNLPNLVLSSCNVSDNTLVPGQSINVTINVDNTGQAATSQFILGIYLSDDEEFQTTDVQLDYASIAEIPAGGNRQILKSVAMPTNIDVGSQMHILGKLDLLNSVLESNENDNTNSVPVSFPLNPNQTGSLVVNIEPQQVVTAGAKWRLDGAGAWYYSGQQVENILIGNHSVDFKSVAGWTKPIPIQTNVSPGSTLPLTGTYVNSTPSGSVTVRITPPSAVSDGCTWSLDGGPDQVSGTAIQNVSFGVHTVNFKESDPDDYEAPAPRTFTLSAPHPAELINDANFTVTSGQGQEFSLDPNGVSHLFWPFLNSNWDDKNVWRDPYTMAPYTAQTNDGICFLPANSPCRTHWGADYRAQDWTREFPESACNHLFRSPLKGRVTSVWKNTPGDCSSLQSEAQGNFVVIVPTRNPDFCFVILHLYSVFVDSGDIVDVGDELGLIGATGTDNAHAHCGLYKNINMPIDCTNDTSWANYSLLELLNKGRAVAAGRSLNPFNNCMESRHSARFRFDATYDPVFGGYVAPPPVAVQVTGTTSFCLGDSAILQSSQADRYLWSTGDTSRSITVYGSGEYQVQTWDMFGTPNTSRVISVFVYEDWEAEISISGDTVILLDEVVTLSGNADASRYYWSNGDTTATISVNEPGTYTLYATDPNGCHTTTKSVVLSYTDQLPATDFETMQLVIAPNPTTDDFRVFCSSIPAEREALIQILDAAGRLCQQGTYGIRDGIIDVNLGMELTPGLYLVRTTISNFSKVKKLIVLN